MKNILKVGATALMTASALLGASANPSAQAAANAARNPFGLVYEGAISKNEAGKTQIKPVVYESRGLKIAANVYLPADFDAAKKRPAIIVAHPNGGVKEQVAGLYAQRLAEAGYVAIAFDAAYQGASEGEPRNLDTPSNRTEDIRATADFIGNFAGVDSDKIGVLGICGGGGYTLNAAKTDKRLKAVATLSMFDSGLVRRNGFLDSELDTIQSRFKAASNARAKEARGEGTSYLGAAPKKLSAEELAKIPTYLYREGMIYYGDTHAHPNSTFAYVQSGLLELAAWDASANMDLLNQPLLMMIGSRADTAYMSEKAFANAINSNQKELYKINGATHIQTYYVPRYVDEIVRKLSEFYGKYL